MKLTRTIRRRTAVIASSIGALALTLLGAAIVAPAAQAASPLTPTNISVTAEADTATFVAGDLITYEITIKNSGSEPLRGASAFLPAGVTLTGCDDAVSVSTSPYTKATTAKSNTVFYPGDELVCTGTHVATSMEASSGQLIYAFDGASQVLPGSESKTPLPKRWYVVTPEASVVG